MFVQNMFLKCFYCFIKTFYLLYFTICQYLPASLKAEGGLQIAFSVRLSVHPSQKGTT